MKLELDCAGGSLRYGRKLMPIPRLIGFCSLQDRRLQRQARACSPSSVPVGRLPQRYGEVIQEMNRRYAVTVAIGNSDRCRVFCAPFSSDAAAHPLFQIKV